MKLNTTPRANLDPNTDRWYREIAQQVNSVSEGRIAAAYNAMTAAPTGGDNRAGDIVRNTAPAELGSAGSKYIITGWICVTSGSPGTWKQMRVLTGG